MKRFLFLILFVLVLTAYLVFPKHTKNPIHILEEFDEYMYEMGIDCHMYTDQDDCNRTSVCAWVHTQVHCPRETKYCPPGGEHCVYVNPTDQHEKQNEEENIPIPQPPKETTLIAPPQTIQTNPLHEETASSSFSCTSYHDEESCTAAKGCGWTFLHVSCPLDAEDCPEGGEQCISLFPEDNQQNNLDS